MEEEQKAQEGEDCYELMEEIFEKLKVLNYEKEFLSKKGFTSKPLNSAYFAVQQNPTEQFKYFITLTKWLFSLNEIQTQDFEKYGDPITVSTNIIQEVKQIGIQVDFPPHKLKSGFGENICTILLALINNALVKKRIMFKKPVYEKSTYGGEDVPLEMEGDKDLELADNQEEEDELLENISDTEAIQKETNEDKQILESKIDEKEWFKECERVGKFLTIQIKNDTREWRSRIEQTKKYNQEMQKLIPNARVLLEKKSDELAKILERIQKREKNINVNMNDQGEHYKSQADDLKVCNNRYTQLQELLRTLQDQYKEISEKFDNIQGQTEDQGNTMSSSSPVMKVKAALQKLRNEIKQMDLRIGVLHHTVTQHKFKERKIRDEKGENDDQEDLLMQDNDLDNEF